MKKITDALSLIDWLQERILERKPQRQVSNAVITLFKDFTEDVKDGDFGWRTLELANIIFVMKSNPGTSKSYKGIEKFFSSFNEYNEFINPELGNMDAVELFIRLMVEELRFDGKGILLSNREPFTVRSQPSLEERFNVKIRVTVKVKEECSTSSRDFSDLI